MSPARIAPQKSLLKPLKASTAHLGGNFLSCFPGRGHDSREVVVEPMTQMDALAGSNPARTTPGLRHIVDVLIEERAPKLSSGPYWPVLRPILYTVLNYNKAVRMA